MSPHVKASCKNEMTCNSSALPPEAVWGTPVPRHNLPHKDGGKKNSFIRFVLSAEEKSFICWGKYDFLPVLPLTCVLISPLKVGRDEFLTFRFPVFELLMRLCQACADCRWGLQSTGLSVNLF